ncbi:CDC27 family protein [Shewanella sp. 10N.286.52.C2]|uniref:CDC27 family protein n=1 Tax=Shewanella sp. 10N.286.52.C2 TaxID=1880838 RepID=UPI0010555514|nr:CDC27 family protein [Shewanella sp. 10N.286.52.C2]
MPVNMNQAFRDFSRYAVATPQLKAILLLIVSGCFSTAAISADMPTDVSTDELNKQPTEVAHSTAATNLTLAQQANLRNKLYRQALYFYFEGDYNAALSQVSLNRQRFDADTAKSHLFEAGLQVSIGLHHQATETLATFEQALIQQQADDKLAGIEPPTEDKQGNKTATSADELKLIALLQLSEQQIEQGKHNAAQQTLANITQLPASYAEQYQILHQLAYWPASVTPSAKILDESAAGSNQADTELTAKSALSAYVMLNQALQLMQAKDYQRAETLLVRIKNINLAATETNFWQSLFTEKSPQQRAQVSSKNVNKEITDISIMTADELKADKQIQQQAINDYAQLLLAQLYVKQGLYQAAFDQLQDFPEHSPYTESALFLFAFSAQQIKRYDTSLALLDLLKRDYQYSQLGWQSALLISAQIKQQNTLSESLYSYQQAEQLYVEQLADLARFHTDIKQTELTPLLFNSNVNAQTGANGQWLQKALENPELKHDIDTLSELSLLTSNIDRQQQKNAWIKESLTLNKQRQARIIEQQSQTQYPELIQQLTNQKQLLAQMITEAEAQENADIFANDAEQAWLKRVNESENVIKAIRGQRSTEEYQQRLNRVKAVLNWELQQQFPQRLWQHKKLLKQVDQQLVLVSLQQQRFAQLANSQQQTTAFEQRQAQAETRLVTTIQNIAALESSTKAQIQQKISAFVSEQQIQLEQLLLASRHEMAAVLEQMSQPVINGEKL